MSSAEQFVLAAYLVVLGVVLVYVVIYSFKLSRLERELDELAELARRRREQADAPAVREPEEVR
jgi:hypothetical protein